MTRSSPFLRNARFFALPAVYCILLFTGLATSGQASGSTAPPFEKASFAADSICPYHSSRPAVTLLSAWGVGEGVGALVCVGSSLIENDTILRRPRDDSQYIQVARDLGFVDSSVAMRALNRSTLPEDSLDDKLRKLNPFRFVWSKKANLPIFLLFALILVIPCLYMLWKIYFDVSLHFRGNWKVLGAFNLCYFSLVLGIPLIVWIAPRFLQSILSDNPSWVFAYAIVSIIFVVTLIWSYTKYGELISCWTGTIWKDALEYVTPFAEAIHTLVNTVIIIGYLHYGGEAVHTARAYIVTSLFCLLIYLPLFNRLYRRYKSLPEERKSKLLLLNYVLKISILIIFLAIVFYLAPEIAKSCQLSDVFAYQWIPIIIFIALVSLKIVIDITEPNFGCPKGKPPVRKREELAIGLSSNWLFVALALLLANTAFLRLTFELWNASYEIGSDSTKICEVSDSLGYIPIAINSFDVGVLGTIGIKQALDKLMCWHQLYHEDLYGNQHYCSDDSITKRTITNLTPMKDSLLGELYTLTMILLTLSILSLLLILRKNTIPKYEQVFITLVTFVVDGLLFGMLYYQLYLADGARFNLMLKTIGSVLASQNGKKPKHNIRPEDITDWVLGIARLRASASSVFSQDQPTKGIVDDPIMLTDLLLSLTLQFDLGEDSIRVNQTLTKDYKINNIKCTRNIDVLNVLKDSLRLRYEKNDYARNNIEYIVRVSAGASYNPPDDERLNRLDSTIAAVSALAQNDTTSHIYLQSLSDERNSLKRELDRDVAEDNKDIIRRRHAYCIQVIDSLLDSIAKGSAKEYVNKLQSALWEATPPAGEMRQDEKETTPGRRKYLRKLWPNIPAATFDTLTKKQEAPYWRAFSMEIYEKKVNRDLAAEMKMSLAENNTLTDMIYFSFVSITTTSFGDIKPVSDTARFWVIIENILEIVFVTILFVTAMNPHNSSESQGAAKKTKKKE